MIKTEIKPEPLNRKTFTTLQIKSLKPGGLGNNRRLLSDKWIRVRDLKSACKFYLRYKDRPDLFEKEQKDLIDYDTWDYRHHTFVILKGNRAIEYNEWLFKLAFKDVFGDKK